MDKLSLQPDEHMKWIYDHSHPEYHTDYAKHLREARASALQSAPRWMIEEALLNDHMREKNTNSSSDE